MASEAENIPTYIKDPGSIVDYHIDWQNYLTAGEVISSSTFLVSAGITVGPTPPSYTVKDTTLWLSGGEIGQGYTCINKIVTNQGRTDIRSILVKIRRR